MCSKVKRVLPILTILALILSIGFQAHAKKGVQLSGVVNINDASAEELTLLPGIGPSKAAAIVTYRSTDKFQTTDDLKKVKGIGDKLFEQVQAYITVDGPTTAKLEENISVKSVE